MNINITLSLPETLVESACRLGEATQRDINTVLTDMLKMLLSTWENWSDTNLISPVSSLSDAEVLALADAKMDVVQNERLGTLQAKGKTTGLTEVEQYELLALLQIYQIGQLRKSEALAEAVKRRLRPLNS